MPFNFTPTQRRGSPLRACQRNRSKRAGLRRSARRPLHSVQPIHRNDRPHEGTSRRRSAARPPGGRNQAFAGDRSATRSSRSGRSIDLGGGFQDSAGRYTLYSGFQYRYDPGIPLVGIGAFVLLAGLCISFYFLPARLYVLIERSAHQAWPSASPPRRSKATNLRRSVRRAGRSARGASRNHRGNRARPTVV